MDEQALQAAIEAMLFAAETPLTVTQVLQALVRLYGAEMEVEQTEQFQQAVEQAFQAVLLTWQPNNSSRGIELRTVAGGYAFRTNKTYGAAILALKEQKPVRLSRAALETLAIVAYKQPITKPEMDDIRGVDCTTTIKILLERQLVAMVGRKEDVGRPALYATTEQFLHFLHLANLEELPPLREALALEQAEMQEPLPISALCQEIHAGLQAAPQEDVQALEDAISQLASTEETARTCLQQEGIELQGLPDAGVAAADSPVRQSGQQENLAS